MKLTRESVAELAKISRIEMNEAELEKYCKELNALEELCSALLPLSGEFSEAYRARGTEAMREDTVGECLSAEALRSIAPAWEDGYIPVPRTVEGSDH